METPESYITRSQAAALIGVTEPCINYYVRTNRLPAIAILGKLGFKRSDVEKLIVKRGTGFPRPGRPARKLQEAQAK
jgi:hypothetical protein